MENFHQKSRSDKNVPTKTPHNSKKNRMGVGFIRAFPARIEHFYLGGKKGGEKEGKNEKSCLKPAFNPHSCDINNNMLIFTKLYVLSMIQVTKQYTGRKLRPVRSLLSC